MRGITKIQDMLLCPSILLQRNNCFQKFCMSIQHLIRKNQDPDWKKAVIVWNGNHAKGNENNLFYKTCSVV